MAVRVGIDLVSVAAVRDSVRDHGDRYLARVYTEAELADCRGATGIMPERLAARFAAKEAALKVLRPAGQPVPWNKIEVVRHPAGWVELKLSGPAATLASDARLTGFTLSMSHEEDYATAVVVAECT